MEKLRISGETQTGRAANALLLRLTAQPGAHDSCVQIVSMQNRLWQKLFLAFAALTVATLLSLYLLQQRAFQRDFLDYVNRIGMERLAQASLRIGSRYEEVGDWSFLIRQGRVFDSLLNGTDVLRPGGALPPRDDPQDFRPPREPWRGQPRDSRPDRPPMDRADDRVMDRPIDRPNDRPTERPMERESGAPNRDDRPRPPTGGKGSEGGPPVVRKVDALNFQTRVVLLGIDDRLVIGNPAVPRDSPSVDVKSRGKVVGRLLLAPLPELQNETDVAFARSQTRHTLVAAAFVLACSLLFAWLLARWLLRPVRALSAGSQRLAAGDYRARLVVERKDELGQLAADFNRLAEALEQNQQARRDWGADIAHELRTPLTILRGEIQAMQDGMRPLNDAALDSLQAECARLGALVEDLYQLALSDAGALEYRFAPLDVGALVTDLAEDHRRALAEAGIRLDIDALPPMPVRGDETRLAQLFGNLFINARRYTDAPGEIRIRAAREGSDWRITVEDSPPGVPPEALPKLFERLFRVESSRNRAGGGAGLGLAICRNIAEAHGGRIEANASPLGGLAVTVQIPTLTDKP